MASAADITIVRVNTNELNNVDPFTDEYIGLLIDERGVSGATLAIWVQKAAQFSSAVDVTEAGASHKFSDLYKNALEMVKYWTDVVDGESVQSGPRVRKIERVS